MKKSLGQHFLKDEDISRRIVAVLSESDFDSLLEVGPGGGALTRHLLDITGVDFRAVELDAEKIEYLLATYPGLKGKLIRGSILDIPIPFDGPFALIGNFPYNISSQILFRILEWKEQVPLAVGMFQKEMAERVAAGEGSKIYGVISVLVQAYYEVEYLFEVHENSFVPPPKVKSAVIRLVRKKEFPAMRSDRHFSVLVKTAFNQRRKKLRNAVRSLFSEDMLADDLFDKRAEQLSVADFCELTFRMQ